MAAGTAVIGSFQFGYNTGVINAPQSVSIQSSTADIISKNHQILQTSMFLIELMKCFEFSSGTATVDRSMLVIVGSQL